MTVFLVALVVWITLLALILYLVRARREKADARSYLDAMRTFNTPADPDRKER